MSPPARTSASSRRNSVGVSASAVVADARLVTSGLEHQLADRQRSAAGRARTRSTDPPGA